MKTGLNIIETRYNLLSKNYKILVIAVLGFFLLIVWFFFFSNLLATLSKNKKNILQAKNEISILKKQVMVLKNSKISNKSDTYKAEEAQLQHNLDELNKQIDSLHYQLVSPKAVFANLKNILESQVGLHLVSLRYLPDEAVQNVNNTQQIFRSPIEITFEGNFSSILNYLKAVENTSKFIFWDEMNYKVTQYPIATVTLKIHVVTSEAGQVHAVAT